MSTLTAGHLVALVGLADLAVAAWFAISASRLGGDVVGTPPHVGASKARRMAMTMAVSGFAMIAIARFTMLWDLKLA